MVARGSLRRSGLDPVTDVNPRTGAMVCWEGLRRLEAGTTECAISRRARANAPEGWRIRPHAEKLLKMRAPCSVRKDSGWNKYACSTALFGKADAHDVAVLAPGGDFEFAGNGGGVYN